MGPTSVKSFSNVFNISTAFSNESDSNFSDADNVPVWVLSKAYNRKNPLLRHIATKIEKKKCSWELFCAE